MNSFSKIELDGKKYFIGIKKDNEEVELFEEKDSSEYRGWENLDEMFKMTNFYFMLKDKYSLGKVEKTCDHPYYWDSSRSDWCVSPWIDISDKY